MVKKLKAITIILGITMLAASLILHAQITTGKLRGYVTDENGEALPGVTIEVDSLSLMKSLGQVTDSSGVYRFPYLPPGRYNISAKIEGFGTSLVKNIPVQVGKTSTINVEMKMATVEESVEVTAQAPLIDSESSAKSYNVNSNVITKVPITPRSNFSAVWYILPGVVGAGAVGGDPYGHEPYVNSSLPFQPKSQHYQDDAHENKTMVDGLEINDSMAGHTYGSFNPEAIEEVDIKTAGAPAEYGNARSSFMNIVSKSGGNEFHGSFVFQYRPESFQTTNVEEGEANKISYTVPSITFSGPILKDTLWFMTSYKYDNEDYVFPNTVVESRQVRRLRSHVQFAKLTFQPTNSHTISISYQNDYKATDPMRFPNNLYSLNETGNISTFGGPKITANWRWIISNSLFFNFTGGYNHMASDSYPQNRVPRRSYTEVYQGGSSLKIAGGYGNGHFCTKHNVILSGNLTYFSDDLWNTGAHEIKIGVDLRPYRHHFWESFYDVDGYNFYQYRYGLDYENYGLSEPYIYRAYLPRPSYRTSEATVSSQSYYIQDSWNINKDLSLQFGIRWEHQRMYHFDTETIPVWMEAIYHGIRDNIQFEDSAFAPRVGLTYNLKEVGVFKFHFGRYLEYVGTGDYNNPPTTNVIDQYRVPIEDIGMGPEALQLYIEGQTPRFRSNYNEGLKMEYNDEFLVSFEREIFWDFAFETSFVYRRSSISHQEDVNAILDEDGNFVGRIFPQFDTIWKRSYLTGDERRTRYEYKGLQFGLKKIFVGNWGLLVNYSRLWADFTQLGFDPLDPRQFVYANSSDTSWHNYGIRWVFHLITYYRFPGDITISTFIDGRSGIWRNDTTGDYGWSDSAPRVTLSNGRMVSDISWQARNSYYVGKKYGESGRYSDTYWNINLRLAKGFKISNIVRAELSLDIFNVFNWCAYTNFQSTDIRRPDRYDVKTWPQPPRAAQVNVRIEF